MAPRIQPGPEPRTSYTATESHVPSGSLYSFELVIVMTRWSGLKAMRCQSLVHPLSLVVHAHRPAAIAKTSLPGGAYGRVNERYTTTPATTAGTASASA